MTAVAIYARYSSDQQRDASIEDQIRLCQERAAREGWHIRQCYTDHAISGASLIRPGVQALLQDAYAGQFEIILAESIDRLSRDQEDIAGIYKRLRFANVRIVTLSEGEVSELHVGLKGTMAALYLRDLADKTRRGLRGRVEAGKSGGGNSYGYDVVKRFGPDGTPIRGDRAINEEEARIVRRIFEEYATGDSPRTIAARLNRDQVPGPPAGAGAPARSTGTASAAQASSTISSMSATSSGTGSATSKTRQPAGACRASTRHPNGLPGRCPTCGSLTTACGMRRAAGKLHWLRFGKPKGRMDSGIGGGRRPCSPACSNAGPAAEPSSRFHRNISAARRRETKAPAATC